MRGSGRLRGGRGLRSIGGMMTDAQTGPIAMIGSGRENASNVKTIFRLPESSRCRRHRLHWDFLHLYHSLSCPPKGPPRKNMNRFANNSNNSNNRNNSNNKNLPHSPLKTSTDHQKLVFLQPACPPSHPPRSPLKTSNDHQKIAFPRPLQPTCPCPLSHLPPLSPKSPPLAQSQSPSRSSNDPPSPPAQAQTNAMDWDWGLDLDLDLDHLPLTSDRQNLQPDPRQIEKRTIMLPRISAQQPRSRAKMTSSLDRTDHHRRPQCHHHLLIPPDSTISGLRSYHPEPLIAMNPQREPQSRKRQPVRGRVRRGPRLARRSRFRGDIPRLVVVGRRRMLVRGIR